VRSSRSGDEGIGCVDRDAASLKVGLVASRTTRSLASRVQVSESVECCSDGLPLSRERASLDLRDVDAARGQRVASAKKPDEEITQRLLPTKMSDKDSSVEEVRAHAGGRSRRPRRTHSAAASRSRQCP